MTNKDQTHIKSIEEMLEMTGRSLKVTEELLDGIEITMGKVDIENSTSRGWKDVKYHVDTAQTLLTDLRTNVEQAREALKTGTKNQ